MNMMVCFRIEKMEKTVWIEVIRIEILKKKYK